MFLEHLIFYLQLVSYVTWNTNQMSKVRCGDIEVAISIIQCGRLFLLPPYLGLKAFYERSHQESVHLNHFMRIGYQSRISKFLRVNSFHSGRIK